MEYGNNIFVTHKLHVTIKLCTIKGKKIVIMGMVCFMNSVIPRIYFSCQLPVLVL